MQDLKSLWILGLTAAVTLSAGASALAANEFITVASTTSTEASGLYEYILPKFEDKTGIDVRVVAVGTGAALDLGRRCDADVELVHAKQAEEKFVEQDYGVKRYPLMYNDFIIVGPKSDPAGIEGVKSATKALQRIAAEKATFMSRGDDSGTNKKELALWEQTKTDPKQASGQWYRETGSGMGKTLNTAMATQGAYTLTDRGTWLNFKNKGDFEILVEGDEQLFNPYGVMLINPEKCPTVKVEAARKFMHWLTSEEGQQAIGSYRLKGKQLFHPNAEEVVPLEGEGQKAAS